MNGIVAYSRPRGQYGYYIFTVVLHFEAQLKEIATIEVSRNGSKYSCDDCGEWATITERIEPIKQDIQGRLTFYRFDNVKPGDSMTITLNDPDLLIYQVTGVSIGKKKVKDETYCLARANYYDNDDDDDYDEEDEEEKDELPDKLYDILLINWDEHIYERQQQNTPIRIEEELIQKTMNAEPIEIKELLLKPAKQHTLKSCQHLIEGKLRYLSDD